MNHSPSSLETATSTNATNASAGAHKAPTIDVADLPPRVRWARALRALSKVLANPEDTERVLEFSNLANAGSRRDERLDVYFSHPMGAKIFAERRSIDSTTIDLAALAALPAGTLGHAYAAFMTSHGLTPNIFDAPPEDVHDVRASFLIQRMRQTHDLWHVVTNCETDPAGEIALQAFTFAQVKAPSTGILAVLGSLRALPHSRRVVRDAVKMYRLGLRAEPFVVFPWEDHWATPLVEVRRLLGMPTSPAVTGGYLTEKFAAAMAA